ncbi:MAG: hypothetical protein R2706_12540 [Acidimicrobiales bacterium]
MRFSACLLACDPLSSKLPPVDAQRCVGLATDSGIIWGMPDSAALDRTPDLADLEARDIGWELNPLLDGAESPDVLLDDADRIADELSELRGSVATMEAEELVQTMDRLARVNELVSRAGNFVMLKFSGNTMDPQIGAAMQAVTERSTAIGTKLIFFELEWAAASDAHVESVLADERLERSRHYLLNLRRNRPHLLSEEAETILAEKSVSGVGAWTRLYSEEMSALTVELPDDDGNLQNLPFEAGLSALGNADRSKRAAAQQAVTDALRPGLRTRAFIFNTLLLDKSVDDRLRSYPTWVSSRNLDNEASDASVDALIEAVVGRYDIPQRWYKVKAEALGLDRLDDYDRMATVADSTAKIGWEEARSIVQTAYRSFSPRTGRGHRHVLRQPMDRCTYQGRQARRRLLRLHRAPAPSLCVPQLDRRAPRRADASLMNSDTRPRVPCP